MLLGQDIPDLRIRMVNVVDIMKPQSPCGRRMPEIRCRQRASRPAATVAG